MDSIPTPVVEALMAIQAPAASGIEFATGTRSVAEKRNALARRMLADPDWKWVLFLDSDNTLPPPALASLLRVDAPVVGGLYFDRRPPYAPGGGWLDPPDLDLAHTAEHWDEVLPTLRRVSGTLSGQVIEVDWVAGGCLLVHRRVLEGLEYPWFVPDRKWAADDVRFCLRAKAEGYPVKLDTSVVLGHVGMLEIDQEFALDLMRSRRAREYAARQDLRNRLRPT